MAVSMLRTTGVLFLLMFVALVLVALLTVIQAKRDETQQVDAIVVLNTGSFPELTLNHALELYRRGYAARLLLTGTQVAEMHAILISQGVPEVALLVADESSQRTARMRKARTLAQAEGVNSVLLVGEPEQLLLDLKMAHDMGLNAYGAPDPDVPLDMQRVVQSSLDYWQYILMGMGSP